MIEDNLAYLLDGKVYINLTNKCTNDCVFCIRALKDDVCGKNLWLKSETFSENDVIEQIKKLYNGEKEFIFCGYGEPTLKLEILKKVAAYIKENYPSTTVRLNTNGHGNFVYKRNIAPELLGLIDEISVSLNASDDKSYNDLSQPIIKCDSPFNEVKDFIKKCSEAGIKTTASIVTGYKNYDVNIEECEKTANQLGAKFRNREWLDNGY